MSRSGYIDDFDNYWDLIKWRGQVASAIRGRRGQKFLRDLHVALEALASKRLVKHELKTEDGEYCALGVLGVVRGIDFDRLDPDEPEDVAVAFDIAHQLAREVVYMNDEFYNTDTPEERYERMKGWVAKLIESSNAPPSEDARPAGGNA